jgi:uncharacterized protein DUF2628
MHRTFEIFKHPIRGYRAVKSGFSWPGFLFTLLWALTRQMWFVGAALLSVHVALVAFWWLAFRGDAFAGGLLSLVFCLVVGFKGNSWRAKWMEARGFEYVCAVSAGSGRSALAKLVQVGDAIPEDWKTRLPATGLSLAPAKVRRLFAMAWLTLKAAFRYRVVQVLSGLLLVAVIGLPSIIKHDGSAQGFTQILLTYTLGAITVLLGFATLWLACGTLARDVEECQMQMVVVKPIARWEIWLGKWLGILLLNALLLGASGAAVYLLMQWRASQLPAEVQAKLRSEIMVARASVKEQVDNAEIEEEVERRLQVRLKESSVAAMDRDFVRKQIREGIKAYFQVVRPGQTRRWVLDFGLKASKAGSQPLYVRTKFFAAQPARSGTYTGLWEIGPPEGRRHRPEPMSLAAETFHEFRIEPDLLGKDGKLTIDFVNYNDTALLFPLEDGIEVLHHEGSFGLNFIRGLGIIFCWLALLATIGLSAGSFLSFPVAAFVSLAILVVGLSSGTVKQVVEEGGISAVNPNTGSVDDPAIIDRVALPFFRGLLAVINLVHGFSPVDSLSTGRSVTWGQLGLAFGQVVLLLGGVFGAVGIITFTRRELATAQGTQ